MDRVAEAAEGDVKLLDVLAEGARLGFIGGDLRAHVAHARRLSSVLDADGHAILDLGSGGGLPGLVIAVDRPDVHVTLLDANVKRTDFLHRAIGRLDLGGRVVVWTGRAEVLGREAHRRGTQDVVVSRAFGTPARTAECASPFLRVGGRLVVSEPPGEVERWPAAGLARLGLVSLDSPAGLRAFRQFEACPATFPRRRLSPPLF